MVIGEKGGGGSPKGPKAINPVAQRRNTHGAYKTKEQGKKEVINHDANYNRQLQS